MRWIGVVEHLFSAHGVEGPELWLSSSVKLDGLHVLRLRVCMASKDGCTIVQRERSCNNMAMQGLQHGGNAARGIAAVPPSSVLGVLGVQQRTVVKGMQIAR